jgi:hypothetical protein
MHFGREWPILLQRSFAFAVNNDSVALMRFAMEAIDDGAAQSRPGQFFYSFHLEEAVRPVAKTAFGQDGVAISKADTAAAMSSFACC